MYISCKIYTIFIKNPSGKYTFNRIDINDICIKQASVFNLDYVCAIIKNIVHKEIKAQSEKKAQRKNKAKSEPLIVSEPLYESEYTRLICAILPYYFKHDSGFILYPEVWGDTFWSQGAKSDLVIGKTDLSNKSSDDYGKSLPKVMIEVKKQKVVSWEMLVKEQLWNQADSLKDKYGKIWVIAMKGLEICIFRFDVTDYPDNTKHF